MTLPSDQAVAADAAEPVPVSSVPASIPSAGKFHLATDAEMRQQARQWFDRVGRFNIDRWPDEVRALSMPTVLIPVDVARFCDCFDGCDDIYMDELAASIDAVTGWDCHFVRLTTRSPKDASYPVAPITCAGKQAVLWLATSMRALDDTVMMKYAGEPLFIAVRQAIPSIRPEREIRCFAKDGEMIAVSRYDYLNAPAFEWDSAETLKVAREFYGAHLKRHYDNVVFDLALGAGDLGGPILIELNPYGLSDPCCFRSYEAIESEGGFLAEALEARSADAA